MNKTIIGTVLGLAVLAASTAASAHTDVAIGVRVPATVYAPAAPAYAASPALVAVGYRDHDDWRAREWRERERRRQEWREHEWREHHRWD